MAALEPPVDDKFTVFLQKSCNPGPFLDPSKVKSLPAFFQERSVSQTIKNVIEALVSAGFNFKETLDKVPTCLVNGTGVKFEITETQDNGSKKIMHHYRLPVLDRKSKGEAVIARFLANLQSCTRFLSHCQKECKECKWKEDLAPSKREPAIKKDQPSQSVKSPKPKSQFIVYCRRNCKVGPLLDPNKIKRLSTSFSGSLPKIIKELVPALVLCGYNPVDVVKRVPSSQGGCILVKVKIGKLTRMCLVGNADSSVKFWTFIRKLCSIFGMCENFFSGKQPKKSSCKKCRNTDFEADYYSSDDDDFQDLRSYKEIIRSIEKRKKTSVGEPTSAKKLKFTDDCNQLQPKELKVVIKRLPQDIVNCYQQRNLPSTPNQEQVKQVYLHGKKVNVVIPGLEKSPRKSLFSEASTYLLSSPGQGKDDEAENMLNISVNQEKTLCDSAVEEMSDEKDEDDDDMLETFLDQGVEDNNAELRALKEMSEKIEERNPLQGLFEKPEEQQVDCKVEEEGLQGDDSFDPYSSSIDASQLFSPSSFFGDVLDSTEMESSTNRIELQRIKSEPQEVATENSKTDKEEEMPKELQAVKRTEQTTDPNTSFPDFASSKGTELEPAVESTASPMDERPFSNAPATHEGGNENDKVDLPISVDSTNDPTLTERTDINVPIPRKKIVLEDGLAAEHSKYQSSSSPTILPLSSQNSAPLSTPMVSPSNNLASLSFPEVLKSLEIKAKSFSEKSVNTTLPQASLGRKMVVNANNLVQSFSPVATPQLQILPMNNSRMSALTSTFGTPQLPIPQVIFSGSGMSSLPGNVSNSSFPVPNGSYATQMTPVVSLPGNPATNCSLPAQNDINRSILSSKLQPVPLTGNFIAYSSRSANHGTDNIFNTNFSSVPLTHFSDQHHLKAYVPSPLRTHGTSTPRHNSNQQQQQVDCNSNALSNRPMNAAVPHLVIQKTSSSNILSPSGSQKMYPLQGQQLPQPLVPSANTGLFSPYSYSGLTNNSLYPLEAPRYYPSFSNVSQTSLQSLSAYSSVRQPTNRPVIGMNQTTVSEVQTLSPYPSVRQPTNQPVIRMNPSTVSEVQTLSHYSSVRQPTNQSVIGMNPSTVSEVQTLSPYSSVRQPTNQSVIGMNPSTVSEVQTLSPYPSVRQPTNQPTKNQSVMGGNPLSVGHASAQTNQFIPHTTLPLDTRQVQSSTNVLTRPSACPVPPVQSSTNVLTRSSACPVPPVQSSTNVLTRPSACPVPPVQSSTNVLTRSSACPVPPVQSLTNVLIRSSLCPVPPVQSSTNVLTRPSACPVPPVKNSTNVLTRSSACPVPPVQSLTNVLIRSSLCPVPSVQSSTNVLTRPSACPVPPVQSSTNVLTRSAACPVPPVQSSANVLTRSSACPVPPVQSSTNVLTRSSACPVPPVQSSTNVLTRSSACPVPPVQSSTNVLTRPSACPVPPVQSSTNVLTRSSACPVPPVQSSTNVLTRSSACPVPPVQSSTNVLTRTSTCAVPPVQSSTNVLTRSSACPVPPVQSSTNVLTRSSACPVPSVQSSTNILTRSSACPVPPVQSLTFESDNITTGPITCNNNIGEAESSNRIKELMVRSPLAKTLLVFVKRCETYLPREKYLILLKKLKQILHSRQQRMVISHNDINDLEELVGFELSNGSIFQDLIKLITSEAPALNDSTSVPHTISSSENQDQQSTSQCSGMMQSVSDVKGTDMETAESDTVADNGTEIFDNGLECNNIGCSSDGNDDDVVIIDQPMDKQTLPTSESNSVNNQTKSATTLNAVSHARKHSSLLPKPSAKVSMIHGTAIFYWDLPDQAPCELIKEYEVYAIQLEVNEKLTKELIQSMPWKKIGNINALPTPMAITLTNLVEGLKSYMIVRAIDADGHTGPFSNLCEVLGS